MAAGRSDLRGTCVTAEAQQLSTTSITVHMIQYRRIAVGVHSRGRTDLPTIF
eukprot:SAG31_NODE_995_length_10494_cov_8.173641_6_plen_52_part_00